MNLRKHFLKFTGNQKGFSLLELIVVLILVGVALPTFLMIMGLLANNHAENEILTRCMTLADSKIEEIFAFKNENPLWFNTIESKAGQETLEGNYTRTTVISEKTNWGNNKEDAYEVSVTVAHPKLPQGYTLTVRLTKFTK